MNLITCKLDAIRLDGGTQPRTGINESVVAEYAEAIMSGATLPPPVCFWDGVHRWLVDGYHRVHAHRQAGSVEIEVDQRNGTLREAILYSVGANATHGLRRSADDKRKAVRLLLEDPEWCRWSDRRIAEATNTSHSLVGKVRDSLTPSGLESRQDASGLESRCEPEVRKFERGGKEHEQRVRAKPAERSPEPSAETSPHVDSNPDGDAGQSAAELLEDMHADLRKAEARVAELEKALTDGGKEQTVTLLQRLDHAERRQAELMEDARRWQTKCEIHERMLMKLGRMLGEKDIDKVPSVLENLARRARAVA